MIDVGKWLAASGQWLVKLLHPKGAIPTKTTDNRQLNTMNSRDTILKRIRDAQVGITPTELPPVEPPWPVDDASSEQRVEAFCANLGEVHGEPHVVDSIVAAAEHFAALVGQESWGSLTALDDPMARDLLAKIPADQITWVEPDSDVESAAEGLTPDEIAPRDAGIIVARYLLADTGSVVLDCPTFAERLLCYLPPVSVVVAPVSALRQTLSAAWDEIKQAAHSTERKGETVVITGPSRTADIEKRLVLGVHGPRRVIVYLVGDK